MLKPSICAILFTFFQTPNYNVAADADGYGDDQDVQDGHFDNGDADDGDNDDSVVSN